MIDELTQCAIEASLKAGDILKKGFGTTFEVFSKGGKNNLVTEYDNLSEDFIIEFIHRQFPEHVFLAEESGGNEKPAENVVRWIIDPLDGTVNFAHSLPIFSISIAAEMNQDLLCGVVYHPILNELFVAKKGGGSTLNGKKIAVSNTTDINSSFLVTGFPYNVDKNPGNCVNHFVDLIKKGIPVRRLGSAALDLAYVACGRFDGFWEIELKPWDVAAGVLLVREAGGNVTQYNNDFYRIENKTMLATNGLIHQVASDTLTKNLIESMNDM